MELKRIIITLGVVIPAWQGALALKCRARNPLNQGGGNPPVPVKDPSKTRDNGSSVKLGGVWWPLPPNYNPSQPDSILGNVAAQSQNMPFGNTLAFNRVIVFGDSSSDTNNQFRATGGTKPSPAYYWQGRVSNGPMWPDYLEKQYGLGLTNYAYGGATVNNQVYKQGDNIPDFFAQVGQYQQNQVADTQGTLAVVNFVGNDLNGGQGPQKLTSDITANLQKLVDLGLTNLVVFQSTNQYYLNTLNLKPAMESMVANFQSSHPQVNIRLFPAWDFVVKYAQIAPSTAPGGVWNPNGKLSCFDQTVASPAVCPNPQSFINFDLYHPTTVPNYNMAIDLAQFINSNWAARL